MTKVLFNAFPPERSLGGKAFYFFWKFAYCCVGTHSGQKCPILQISKSHKYKYRISEQIGYSSLPGPDMDPTLTLYISHTDPVVIIFRNVWLEICCLGFRFECWINPQIDSWDWGLMTAVHPAWDRCSGVQCTAISDIVPTLDWIQSHRSALKNCRNYNFGLIVGVSADLWGRISEIPYFFHQEFMKILHNI